MSNSFWYCAIVLCFCHCFIITGYEQSPLVTWVEQGNETILYCNLGGTEESFDWTRGPNYTASTQNLLAYNNRGVIRGQCLTQGKCELLGKNLKLKDATIADEDTYYCGTPKSHTSVVLKVTIEPSSPTINNCNENKKCAIIFPVGFPLYLTCSVRGSRPAADLVWSTSTHTLTNLTQTSVYPNQDGTFDTVSFLYLEHNAPTVYKCEAHGPSIRESLKAMATINVTDAIDPDMLEPMSSRPEISFCDIQPNCSLTWPIGLPLQIKCILRGIRNPLELFWWNSKHDLSKNTTTEQQPGTDGAIIYVSTVTLHITESSEYYCIAGKDSSFFGDLTTSMIHISATDVLPLHNDNMGTDAWKILTIILVFLMSILILFFVLYIFLKRKTNCRRVFTGGDEKGPPVSQGAVQENPVTVAPDPPTENYPLLLRDGSPKVQDEADGFQTPDRSAESAKVQQPTDNGTPHSSQTTPVVQTDNNREEVVAHQRISTPATYPDKGETSSDFEETTTENASSSSSDEMTTLKKKSVTEKLSSSKFKGFFITPKLIRENGSFNFSLDDQEVDILLKFSMKGYGLVLSFVPYLEKCDVGYTINFQKNGNITFSKHGMNVDLDGDKNRYDTSKRLTFILNTASGTVLLMQEDSNNKKQLLRYNPVQTELCSYLVISAKEHSEFDMVLFPIR